MELYSDKDLALVEDKIEDIVKKIEEKKLEIFPPTRTEIMAVNKLVLDFIRDKKRKIYGGYAQNKAIILKNPADGFYSADNIPDIDIYSPEPIADLMGLANHLYNLGYKNILATEAIHKETYTLFVDGANACDISYVPTNIYHRIPFIESDNINYAHPSFMMIDLYKMLTEPYFSSFRWKKTFPRIYKLQKYYPFNKPSKNIPDISIKSDTHNRILDHIFDLLKNNPNIICFGPCAYNYFLDESGYKQDNFINIPNYQVISTDYLADAYKILNSVKDNFKIAAEKISYVEYYPFWTFQSHAIHILYDGNIILDISNNNKRCIPIKKLVARKFINNKPVPEKNNYIQVGCFDFQILMAMIYAFHNRVEKKDLEIRYYNNLLSHLIQMRDYYFGNNKSKNLLDETIFQEFISTCTGEALDPKRENKLARARRRKAGKPVTFSYDPSIPRELPNYKFANSSGNSIKNIKNLKLSGYNPEKTGPEDESEYEDE